VSHREGILHNDLAAGIQRITALSEHGYARCFSIRMKDLRDKNKVIACSQIIAGKIAG